MVFLGDLDAPTASATTISASSVVASPGTFRIGGTVGSTFKSFRWNNQVITGVDTGGVVVSTVTLSPAMPDTGYVVFLTPRESITSILGAEVDNKTTTSFQIRIRKRGTAGALTIDVPWVVIDF
jgi:hypothetical protein